MNAVNPSHYRGFSNGAEVIDIIEHLAANRANAIKYLARAGRKDDEMQELSKALWYVAREILRIGGQEALSSAVKELPGEKTASSVDLLTEAMKDAPVHPHTYERLGEDEKIEGVVYRDAHGEFWTWRGTLWKTFDRDLADWFGDVQPYESDGPYVKTDLSVDEVA